MMNVRSEIYVKRFPEMYEYVYDKLRTTHMKSPTVLEVLSYLMVMTGDEVEKLVELMKEMEKNDD